MSKKRLLITAALLIAAGLFSINSTVSAQTKPQTAPPCLQCHKPDEKVLRGALGNVSMKAETIQVQTGAAVWLVKFDDNTKLTGAEKLNKIPREKEIAISFTEKDGGLYAASVSVKPPAKIRDEQFINAGELAKLVAAGPEQGNFTLVDSRPAPKFNEGFIPGAINIYDAQFDKNIAKLPKEKDELLIFYCAGPT